MHRELARLIAMPAARHSLVRSIGRGRRDNRGVAAVEFSIVAPLLILMMICTTDLGLGIFRMLQVQNAAYAGAQYAILHGFNEDSIVTAVKSATSYSDVNASPSPNQFCGCPTLSGVGGIDCASTCSDGSTPGTYVTVSAAGKYETLFSYPVIPSSYEFAAQSTVRIQ
jgi:Flp pilus assembly protein TadG